MERFVCLFIPVCSDFQLQQTPCVLFFFFFFLFLFFSFQQAAASSSLAKHRGAHMTGLGYFRGESLKRFQRERTLSLATVLHLPLPLLSSGNPRSSLFSQQPQGNPFWFQPDGGAVGDPLNISCWRDTAGAVLHTFSLLQQLARLCYRTCHIFTWGVEFSPSSPRSPSEGIKPGSGGGGEVYPARA